MEHLTGNYLFIYLFTYLFIYLRAAPAAYGVPWRGVELELQLQAYTTARATPDPSHICNLHCSLWQRWILNPLSEARDGSRILTETMSGLNLLSRNRNACRPFCF